MKEWRGYLWRQKKWMVLVLFLVILAGTAQMYWKSKNTPVATVTMAAVERGNIQSNVSATGTISAVNSVDISSRVTGLIRELRVQENDTVKAGQVLLVLDDTSLQAQVAQYRAQLENYAAVYERSKRLTAIGGQSVQQVETDRTNYLVAKSNYDNYASQLEYYVITSPVDGVVVGKPTPAGQTVAQGISTPQVIMTIADMSKMQIKTQVDETDIGKIKQGQTVSFTVDAYPDRVFTGKVTSISKSATTSSNVVYYPVYVDVDSPEGLLYPTMTARVTIHISERNQVLVVPIATVKEENGVKYVQMMVNGKQEQVAVQTGSSDGEKTEIISGLNEGDTIVIPALSSKKSTTSKQQQGPPPPM